MSSLSRAKDAQRSIEQAASVAAHYNAITDRCRKRFHQLILETVEDDPKQILQDAWLEHHVLNTLEWPVDVIAEKLGMTKDQYLETWKAYV